jgi:hypothetical protein
MDLDDNPAKITATHRARNRSISATSPDLWISPFAYQSFLMVDAACDRWLKQRAELRRQRDDRGTAAPSSSDLHRADRAQ